jgi:hypothetical protein
MCGLGKNQNVDDSIGKNFVQAKMSGNLLLMMVNHLGENEKVWIRCVKERYFPWYLKILLTN